MRKPITLIFTLSALALAGCSNSTSGSADDNSEPTDNLTLSGVVAYGQGARHALICVNSVVDNALVQSCDRSDSQGDYSLSSISQSSGLAQSQYIDSEGDEYTLYSLYNFASGASVQTLNINPLTDILTAAYVNELGATPTACFSSVSCLTSLQSINTTLLNNITEGLKVILDSVWPKDMDGEDAEPFTETYLTSPTTIPYLNTDGLIEQIAFEINNGQLELRKKLGSYYDQVVASVPLSHLKNSQEADFLTLPGITLDQITDGSDSTADEANSILTYSFAGSSPPDPLIVVTVTIANRNGSDYAAPLPARITINPVHTSDTTAFDSWIAELRGPENRYSTWSNQTGILETDLDEPGLWRVHAIATDVNGQKGTGYADIMVTVGPSTQAEASFGQSGSCQPDWSHFTQNSINQCIETLNGGLLGELPECDDLDTDVLIHQSGRCSIFYQYQNPNPTISSSQLADDQANAEFLGHCSNITTETRTFHYVNPERNTGETTAEAQTRLQYQCENLGGSWTNAETVYAQF